MKFEIEKKNHMKMIGYEYRKLKKNRIKGLYGQSVIV